MEFWCTINDEYCIYTCTEVDLSYMNSTLVWRNRWVWDCQLRSVTYIHIKRVNKFGVFRAGLKFCGHTRTYHVLNKITDFLIKLRLSASSKMCSWQYFEIVGLKTHRNCYTCVTMLVTTTLQWYQWFQSDFNSTWSAISTRHSFIFLMMSNQLLFNPAVNTTQVLLLSS